MVEGLRIGFASVAAIASGPLETEKTGGFFRPDGCGLFSEIALLEIGKAALKFLSLTGGRQG